MTMNKDVFLAILAMDSYNRGYGAGVDLGLGSDHQGMRIGNATIDKNADDPGGVAQAAGFYALSYTVNGVAGIADGTPVISYRGTDFTTGISKILDFVHGWSSFTKLGTDSQFGLARQFYTSVTGFDFPNTNGVYLTSNAILTGHSLGGALAGYIGRGANDNRSLERAA